MSTTYTKKYALTGYADSVNATGRMGPSAFSLAVDFSQAGAGAVGLVATDIFKGLGTLPQNCVVRTVAAQVVKPLTVVSADGITALPMTLNAGSTTLAVYSTLHSLSGPTKGAVWTAVSLADGTTGVAGAKADLSLTIGAVLDNATPAVATAITGGIILFTFFVDYICEVDELVALFSEIDHVSDGGNTAAEASIT